MPQTRILIVDDEPGIVFLCKRLLARAGYNNVETQFDPREAISYLKKNTIDLLLVDIRMPEVDGFEVISYARRYQPDITVLIMTGHGTVETAIRALRIRADGLILKPFSKGSELVGAVELALADNQQGKIQTLEFVGGTLKQENQNLKDELAAVKMAKAIAPSDNLNKNYIASILHNLKSELLHIKFATDNLLELLGENESSKLEQDLLARSCDYSYVLVQRAMDSLDVGKPQIETVNLMEVINRLDTLLRPRLTEKITLKFVFKKKITAPIIKGNSTQLLGILYEFIENSIAELRSNGGNIEVSLETVKGKVIIIIRDSGRGIPNEIKDRIFKEQVPSEKGSGLGLFLNNKAITDMGGTLGLKSMHGKGAEITIVFPTVKGKK